MADEGFDEVRERLVIETKTIWPADLADVPGDERKTITQALHGEPQKANEVAYVRQHTGFRREITVTRDDVKRIRAYAS